MIRKRFGASEFLRYISNLTICLHTQNLRQWVREWAFGIPPFHFMAVKQKLPRAFCQLTGGGQVQISVLTMSWRKLLGMEK